MSGSAPLPREYLEAQKRDERWWLPWAPRREFLRQIRALWAAHYELSDAARAGLTNMKEQIMATAAEYAARVDAATNELASDLKSVRDRLSAVEQAAEGDKQAAVDAALAELEVPIARLESLGREDDAPTEQPASDAPVDAPSDDTPPDAVA